MLFLLVVLVVSELVFQRTISKPEKCFILYASSEIYRRALKTAKKFCIFLICLFLLFYSLIRLKKNKSVLKEKLLILGYTCKNSTSIFLSISLFLFPVHTLQISNSRFLVVVKSYHQKSI